MKNKDIEPYTLICLYIRTLTPAEREAYHITSGEYDEMRFDSKAFNALSDRGYINWDVVRMKAALTDEGKKFALSLIQEISDR